MTDLHKVDPKLPLDTVKEKSNDQKRKRNVSCSCTRQDIEQELTEEEKILQNLIDAGCCEKLIAQFKDCMESDQICAEIQLLKKHRQKLLDKLHTEQKRIDCIDYLIYKLKHEQENR